MGVLGLLFIDNNQVSVANCYYRGYVETQLNIAKWFFFSYKRGKNSL